MRRRSIIAVAVAGAAAALVIIGAVGATDLGGNKGQANGQTDCNIGGFLCKK
jgi:hypothetical protein